MVKNIIFVSSTSKKLVEMFKECIRERYIISWYTYQNLASWILEQGLGYEMTTNENELVTTLAKALDDYGNLLYKDLLGVIEQFEAGELGTDFLIVEFPCSCGIESTVARYAKLDRAGRRMGRDNILSLKLSWESETMSKPRTGNDNSVYDYDIYNTDNEVQMKMKARRLMDNLLADILEARG